jgi:alkyl sulfatase BDS1-like metallo-beta-lactamase superfamily hydrolase
MKLRTTLIITLASVLGAGIASAQQQGTSPKPASKATKAANLAMQRYLNFNQKEDFENAARGDDQERAGATDVGPRIVQGLHQFG